MAAKSSALSTNELAAAAIFLREVENATLKIESKAFRSTLVLRLIGQAI